MPCLLGDEVLPHGEGGEETDFREVFNFRVHLCSFVVGNFCSVFFIR